MAYPLLNAEHFHNEEAAFAYVEAMLWPNGPVCPHCGAKGDKIGRLTGKSARVGLRKCYACRKQFTVRIGTIFEDSHLALHLWLQVIHLMTSSKKGVSTRQIQRLLNCSMKTAWFLTHRIREIMKDGGEEPIGGEGEIVEVDETYVGRKEGRKKRKGTGHKLVVLSLVQRNGKTRSFHVQGTSARDLLPILARNVYRTSYVMTDEAGQYNTLRDHFNMHDFVTHAREEYVRGNVSTNTVEGFFSIFKRGMTGIYQHCSETHLHRYLSEFDFRYSNREKLGIDDATRTALAIHGSKGRRLTYERTRGEETKA